MYALFFCNYMPWPFFYCMVSGSQLSLQTGTGHSGRSGTTGSVLPALFGACLFCCFTLYQWITQYETKHARCCRLSHCDVRSQKQKAVGPWRTQHTNKNYSSDRNPGRSTPTRTSSDRNHQSDDQGERNWGIQCIAKQWCSSVAAFCSDGQLLPVLEQESCNACSNDTVELRGSTWSWWRFFPLIVCRQPL